MHERAIENWLTNVSEKGYQGPFAHLLMHEGQTVIYNSMHRPLEQGKDLASRDASGGLHAYQLKQGKIDLTAWRRIATEIDDLCRMPIRHTSVSQGEMHRAYLVTNGRVADEVIVYVKEYNDANRPKGWAHLEIVQKEELLKRFVAVQ